MFKKLFLASLVVVPTAGYFYHGFHKTSPISKTEVSPQIFLYIQHVGAYQKLNDSFQILEKDLKQFKQAGNKISGFKWTGIYYDDPRTEMDKTKHRASIGFWCDPSSQESVEAFLKKFPNYSISNIPQLTTVHSTLRYVSPISILYAFHTIHSQLRDYAQKNNLTQDPSHLPLLEFYDIEGDHISYIDTHFAYGQDVDKLQLSNSPAHR